MLNIGIYCKYLYNVGNAVLRNIDFLATNRGFHCLETLCLLFALKLNRSNYFIEWNFGTLVHGNI